MVDKQEGTPSRIQAKSLQRRDIRSVSEFVEELILHAFKSGSSDIHIDPMAFFVDIRMRCLGSMAPYRTLASELHEELIGRIKILSRLRTDIHDRAQDGRFSFSISKERRNLDIRVSVLPTFFGENAVMRILRPEEGREQGLESLGMLEAQRGSVLDALQASEGMIIVAGPTGSGKTTSMYSMLEFILESKKNIITIEDPVEYVLPGARQIQVSDSSGFGFAMALKAIMRQDPDIVVIGEMRDAKTAELAFQAAQTGHLVIASLHAEDSAGVHSRLMDLGVSPRAMHSLTLIVCQRLILCKPPSDDTDSGYEMRTGVFEVVRVFGKAKQILFSEEFPEIKRERLRKLGEILLLEACQKKRDQGFTFSGSIRMPGHE